MIRLRLRTSKRADAAAKRLRRVGQRLRGAWGSMPSRLLDALVEHVRKDFPPAGLAPLKPSTLAIRRRLGYGDRMLFRTGTLLDSITVFRLGSRGGVFGANAPGAPELHDGDGDLVARRFLDPSDRAVDDGLRIIGQALGAA